MLGRGTTQERRTQVDGKPSSIADRKQPPHGCTDRFENQQISRDAAQMEAKNLRGRESENRRIWSREFNIDFFTRVGYADIRNRGATGKRLVPLQCYRSNCVLGGRAVTSFC